MGKIFVGYLSDKGLVSQIYNGHLQLNNKKITHFLKTAKGSEQAFLQRYTNSQYTHEEMLNIVNYQTDVNQNPTRAYPQGMVGSRGNLQEICTVSGVLDVLQMEEDISKFPAAVAYVGGTDLGFQVEQYTCNRADDIYIKTLEGLLPLLPLKTVGVDGKSVSHRNTGQWSWAGVCHF